MSAISTRRLLGKSFPITKSPTPQTDTLRVCLIETLVMVDANDRYYDSVAALLAHANAVMAKLKNGKL